MQHTYQIELSLSNCNSVPAVSPTIWKENFFFLNDCNCKRQVIFYGILITDKFRLATKEEWGKGKHTSALQ